MRVVDAIIVVVDTRDTKGKERKRELLMMMTFAVAASHAILLFSLYPLTYLSMIDAITWWVSIVWEEEQWKDGVEWKVLHHRGRHQRSSGIIIQNVTMSLQKCKCVKMRVGRQEERRNIIYEKQNFYHTQQQTFSLWLEEPSMFWWKCFFSYSVVVIVIDIDEVKKERDRKYFCLKFK